MEYYLAMKNEIMNSAGKMDKFRSTVLSEATQIEREKNYLHVLSHMWILAYDI